MQTVKVQRRGISQEQAAEAIGQALGSGYRVEFAGNALDIRKGLFGRARVTMRDEPDGTVFEVNSQGLPLPLLYISLKVINEKGIATHTAKAIGRPETFPGAG